MRSITSLRDCHVNHPVLSSFFFLFLRRYLLTRTSSWHNNNRNAVNAARSHSRGDYCRAKTHTRDSNRDTHGAACVAHRAAPPTCNIVYSRSRARKRESASSPTFPRRTIRRDAPAKRSVDRAWTSWRLTANFLTGAVARKNPEIIAHQKCQSVTYAYFVSIDETYA